MAELENSKRVSVAKALEALHRINIAVTCGQMDLEDAVKSYRHTLEMVFLDGHAQGLIKNRNERINYDDKQSQG